MRRSAHVRVRDKEIACMLTATAGAPGSWPLVDTLDRVIEAVHRFQEAGVSHLVMDTFYSIPELDQETVDSILPTMELFARSVIPQFATG